MHAEAEGLVPKKHYGMNKDNSKGEIVLNRVFAWGM